jgi:hypothetical protein
VRGDDDIASTRLMLIGRHTLPGDGEQCVDVTLVVTRAGTICCRARVKLIGPIVFSRKGTRAKKGYRQGPEQLAVSYADYAHSWCGGHDGNGRGSGPDALHHPDQPDVPMPIAGTYWVATGDRLKRVDGMATAQAGRAHI